MGTNLFTEGCIFYYENKVNTKKDYSNCNMNHDFLVSRPVYILDSKELPFDTHTVNVLIITSSHNRVGIPISVDGYRNGKILPHAIYSVHKEYLTKYMGNVSKEMKEEVREAVSYHLGYSDKKPSYIIEYEKRLAEIESFVSQLTPKEKTVNELIEQRCIIKDIFFVKFDEIFKYYLKTYPDGYTRQRDFTKALNKLMEIYPEIKYDTKDNEKIIRGMSINGNTHKEEILKKETAKRRVNFISNNLSDMEIKSMTKDQILNSLSARAKETYERFDWVEKITYWKSTPDKYDFETDDELDKRFIYRLIMMEVNDRRYHVFKKLSGGYSPFELSVHDQYILWKCSNDELRKHIAKRFFTKKGGIHKIRKSLENNVKHLFPRDF